MKSCLHCKYADWRRRDGGNLHPSGDGVCKYPWTLPPIPASMYWVCEKEPRPDGGFISRKTELRDHCVYFGRALK